MSEEVWKRYDERYEVSSFGNVRNEERLLKQFLLGPNRSQYKAVSIHRKPKKVHQLVAICFLNHVPCGHKIVVDHKDTNTLNNRLNNLQLITNRENLSKDKNRGLPLGVYKNGNKFQSAINFNNKSIRLGTFNTPREAHEQYKKALKCIKNGSEIQIKKPEFSSKYKGVHFDKTHLLWVSKYKCKHLGYFKTELEAYICTVGASL